jgi:hypothetical protein
VPIIKDQAFLIATKATHCGMCKIDFLGTGLCPSGKKYGFASYWPEGRMELMKALREKTVMPTKKLLEIVNSCTMCGICDRQCYFITNLRPSVVQQGLLDYVKNLDHHRLKDYPADEVLRELQQIVGEQWASNDPVVLCGYRRSILIDNSKTPLYVVMPRTVDELSKVVADANRLGIPFLPRGNGTFFSVGLKTVIANPLGLHSGIIIDVNRMKSIDIDPIAQTATIGAGVSAYELQQATLKHHLRVIVGEAGARISVNVATFGPISTWGNTYGWGADNFIDVELVDKTGRILNISDTGIENLYASPKGPESLTLTPSYIITKMTMKLHPVYPKEHAFFVPFEQLEDAWDFASNLARRNIGLSLAILSSRFFSDFICPTERIARDFEYVARNHLHMNYLVDIICLDHESHYIKKIAPVTIDENMSRDLYLSTPNLASLKDNLLLKTLAEEKNPIDALFNGPLRKHLFKVLQPSPDQLAALTPSDLQDFYKKIYAKPEMTDPIWLHEFRILPSRMLRQHMFINRGGYLAAQKDLILSSYDMLEKIGDKYHLDHALGFISFIDEGKFVFFEYDYYYDHTNPEEVKRFNNAVVESYLGGLSLDGYLPAENVFHKGLHRKEHVFYPIHKGLSQKELQEVQKLLQQIAK